MGWRRHWPLWATLGLFLLAIAWCVGETLRRCDGHFVYALDDAYIAMAIAKQMALHQVWGPTQYEYAAASSSLFWPLATALSYRLVGVNIFAPLVMSLLASTGLLVLVYRILWRRGVSAVLTFAVLMLIAFCTPLTSMVFTGLEHPLHALVSVAFLYATACMLAGGAEGRGHTGWAAWCGYLVLAAVLGMTRFESMFMLAPAVLLFLVRGRFLGAILVGAAGWGPIGINGLISWSHGAYFLPNSVVLKGNAPFLSSWQSILRTIGGDSYTRLLLEPTLPIFILAGLALAMDQYRRHGRFWTVPTVMIWGLIPAILMHAQVAKLGMFLRYESYLVAAGLATVAIAGAEWMNGIRWRLRWQDWPLWTAVLLLLALVLPPFVRRSVGVVFVPQAARNNYHQQVQMARFLDRYYPGVSLAANDIGCITFFPDIRLLDLAGLGSLDVAQARMQKRFNTEVIGELARKHGCKLAIAYEHWFVDLGGMPRDWQVVAQWRLFGNVICGGEVVTFYAVDPAERDRLAARLKEFEPELPKGVEVGYPRVEYDPSFQMYGGKNPVPLMDQVRKTEDFRSTSH